MLIAATQPDFATELALLRQRIDRQERWQQRCLDILPLAVAVAVLLAVWSWQSALGERVARVEAMVAAHATETDRRFDAIDRRFNDIDRQLEQLATQATNTNTLLARIEAQLDVALAARAAGR